MKLITDSDEKLPISFPVTEGVEHVRQKLVVGDYAAWHGDQADPAIVERKSVSDLFTSFTSNYEAEKAKIMRAQQLNLTYILAIEGTASEILKGHSYWKGGERHEHKKTGMAQFRQLMTLQRKYGIQVWFCSSRSEMALQILEFFLAQERVIHDNRLRGSVSISESQTISKSRASSEVCQTKEGVGSTNLLGKEGATYSCKS